MFHRVDEPLELRSSRFFEAAQRLHLRGGAVTAARVATEEREVILPPPPVAGRAPADVDNSSEIAAIAAMSQNPGFPGIGYSGG